MTIQPRFYFTKEQIRAAVTAFDGVHEYAALSKHFKVNVYHEPNVGYFYLGHNPPGYDIVLDGQRGKLHVTESNHLIVVTSKLRRLQPIRLPYGKLRWNARAPATYLCEAVLSEMNRTRQEHTPYANDLLSRLISAEEQRTLLHNYSWPYID